jgi:hypothetical protein
MNVTARIRTVATWLLLAGAVVSAVISVTFLRQLYLSVGLPLLHLDPAVLPTFSAALLGHFYVLTSGLWVALVVAIVTAAAAMRYSSTRERGEYTTALATYILYHAVLCAWLAAIAALVILPHAKGI